MKLGKLTHEKHEWKHPQDQTLFLYVESEAQDIYEPMFGQEGAFHEC